MAGEPDGILGGTNYIRVIASEPTKPSAQTGGLPWAACLSFVPSAIGQLNSRDRTFCGICWAMAMAARVASTSTC